MPKKFRKTTNGRLLEEIHITRSEEETFLLARNMARKFKGREVVLLEGELGAGKTVFAKGLASGIGLGEIDRVCSPSYTLVNIYRAKFPIFHIDLYRLEKESEILDLGWEDYLGEGVVIVEWAEKIPFGLDSIRVTIEISKKNERRIKVLT